MTESEENKMACFLVPAAEAVITTTITKVMEAKAKKKEAEANQELGVINELKPYPLFKKMKWLNNMLWGGTALLAFEHIWHGEVVPWFPFLTNTSNPSDALDILREISTTGVAMAVSVTLVWIGMVVVSNTIEKRPSKMTLKR